jgi:predicted nucleotidyltransferase
VFLTQGKAQMVKQSIQIPRKQLVELCRRYHVRRLALFGSVLRNDFRPDSDVDVLVLFEPDAQIGFMALGHMKRELSVLFRRPVDLVPQDGLKPVIRESVLSSAEEVYAA